MRIVNIDIVLISGLFLLEHVGFNASNRSFQGHVVLRSDTARVFPLLSILLFALLLLPKLLEGNNVFTLLLKNQFIDLFFNLRFHSFLIQLGWVNNYLIALIMIMVHQHELVIVDLMNVVEDHQAEGKCVENVQKLVTREVLIDRQIQGGHEPVLHEITLTERIIKA
jgi:hypothetical protein